MSMRLWFHNDSDSLHISEDWDGVSEDVTDVPLMRKAAKDRGMKFTVAPEVTSRKMDHTVASAIIGSMSKWDRKPADFYPTPVDVTESLVPVLQAMGVEQIWEPACGDGRMARVLEWHGFNTIATDIREYPGYGEGGIDFLTEHPTTKWGWDIGKVDAIVTNPPFKLAEAFIRRALSITPRVAMLLKSQYWHAASRKKLFDAHRPKLVLPLTWRPSFLEKERGNSPLMDVVWVIWNESDEDYCAYEPITRRRYAGYHGRGLKEAAQILEGELFSLSGVIRGLL